MNFHVTNELTVSIMPLYQCNNDCPYCYLGTERNSGYHLSPRAVEDMLNKISEKVKISCIEIYGGDLALYPFTSQVIQIAKYHTNNIHITHNNIRQCYDWGFRDENINLSLNIERRDFRRNILQSREFPKVGIITVVTDDICNREIEKLFDEWYSHLTGYLTFMPLSNNTARPTMFVTNYEYCAFMIRALTYYHEHEKELKFELTNDILLRDAIQGRYSPDMDNNVFITPKGKFACIDYNERGIDGFKEFDSFNEWQEYAYNERFRLSNECNMCIDRYRCMTDHFRPEWTKESFNNVINDVCSGCQPLLRWAEQHPEYGYVDRILKPGLIPPVFDDSNVEEREDLWI